MRPVPSGGRGGGERGRDCWGRPSSVPGPLPSHAVSAAVMVMVMVIGVVAVIAVIVVVIVGVLVSAAYLIFASPNIIRGDVLGGRYGQAAGKSGGGQSRAGSPPFIVVFPGPWQGTRGARELIGDCVAASCGQQRGSSHTEPPSQ